MLVLLDGWLAWLQCVLDSEGFVPGLSPSRHFSAYRYARRFNGRFSVTACSVVNRVV